MIGINEQISCLDAEIRRRKRTFPKLVADGRMPQDRADLEITRMQAAVETLKQLRGMVK